MVLKALLTVMLASASLACVDETTVEPRSTRSPYNESSRSVGTDSPRGGSDMPGKGRGGEHHSMERHPTFRK